MKQTVFLLILLAIFSGSALVARAAVRTVTRTDDLPGGCAVDCALRQAIASAAAGDTIVFSPLFDTPQTITLTLGQLTIARDLTIDGPGANRLTVSGGNASRVFFINPALTVALNGLTISNGAASFGGGIFDQGSNISLNACAITGNTALSGGGITSGGHLTISNSTVSGNTAQDGDQSGGGIETVGLSATLVISDSTVSGNVVQSGFDSGGGIFALGGGTITNSTITNNSAGTAANSAGGIYSPANTLTIRNSIVAADLDNSNVPDVRGEFASAGFNLIGNVGSVAVFNQPGDRTGDGAGPLNPLLGGLADNGGPTQTHVPAADSPALDGGNSFGAAFDQRGNPRSLDNPFVANAAGGDGTDTGAFERGARVTKINDTNDGVCNADCSLREAIGAAQTTDFIIFSSLFDTPQTILLDGQLTIGKNLTIVGAGADRTVISGNNAGRVFNVNGAVTVDLSGLTITGGNVPAGDGGGILNQGGANLTLRNCVVNANAAQKGGGIRSVDSRLHVIDSTISNNVAAGAANTAGGIESYRDNNTVTTDLEVINSTVSGNSATGNAANAGGILVQSVTFFSGFRKKSGFAPQSASALISNSTITGNSVTPGFFGVGGGIRRGGGTTLTVRSTIVAGNAGNSVVPDTVADFDGGFVSGGYNLIGNRGILTAFNQTGDQAGTSPAVIDPQLLPLAGYGGTTPTHRPLAGSPAIDAGSAFGLTTDQRGWARTFDLPGTANVSDGTDVGAFELQLATAASVTVGGRVFGPSGGLGNALVVLTDAGGNQRIARTNSFGYYRFENVEAGNTYVVSATFKRYAFAPQLITVADDLTTLDFYAAEAGG